MELEHVSAATDGTEHGQRAVETAAEIARRANAAFEVISVADASLPSQPLKSAGEETDWSRVLQSHLSALAREQLRNANAEGSKVRTEVGRPASTIVEMANSAGADLLVLGAHNKPALSRFLLGSTSEKVVRLAQMPLLIATETGTPPFERILVAIDTSPHSREVLGAAAAFGKVNGSAVKAIYTWEPAYPIVVPQHMVGAVPPPVGAAESKALVEARRQEELAEFERLVAEAGNVHDLDVEKVLREGHAGVEIVKEAEDWDADLVVMGTHGAGFFDRVMMGSRSLHVLRHAERTVLLVPIRDSD